MKRFGNSRGMSLRELIILITIVSLLGFIAYKRFSRVHEMAKNSAEAGKVLQEIYQLEIEFREAHHTFTTNLDSLNLPGRQVPFFSVEILDADSTKFIAKAIPDSSGIKAELKPLVIDENGKVIEVR